MYTAVVLQHMSKIVYIHVCTCINYIDSDKDPVESLKMKGIHWEVCVCVCECVSV